MAGDWIKMRVDLGDDPAVLKIAAKTGLDEDTVVGKLHRIWSWADRHTLNGTADSVTVAWVDRFLNFSGFAAAMVAAGWLIAEEEAISFPAFERHNGASAKKRCDDQLRQRQSRKNREAVTADEERRSHAVVTKVCDNSVTREEKSERREEISNRDRTDRQIGAGSDQSPLEIACSRGGNTQPAAARPPEPRGEPLDVSEVDWDAVVQRAERLAQRVPPNSSQDRRQWLRFSVLVERGMFSEHWLLDSAEAVVNSPRHNKNRQAHLVAVLKKKAAEEGTDGETLKGILRRIEIPDEVWQRSTLPVRKKSP